MFVKMTLVLVTIISITFFGISTFSGHPLQINPAAVAATVVPSDPVTKSTPVISTPSASTTRAALGDNKLFLPALWSFILPTVTPSPTVTPVPTVTTTPIPPANGIFVNHSSVAQFASIPNDKILAASNLRMLFMHKSVGEIINLYLDCLQGLNNWGCDSDPKYDHGKWNWPLFAQDNFAPKKTEFDSAVQSQNASYDVFGYKLCFIDDMTGTLTPQDKFTQYRNEMLALETQYPTKKFIWATQALWAAESTYPYRDELGIQTYNNLVRDYAYANNKIFFDLADIESHAEDGTACYSPSGHEALCSVYTNQGDDGHPNTIGSIRLAQAVWVLMAKIAGWQP